ncbi:hypothetical protein HanPSC8_Chr08g0313131 [Helianthus annuus]|nr:hypothetical protein HanPSC8_Chr08g0313131 [Helianthus annuus]
MQTSSIIHPLTPPGIPFSGRLRQPKSQVTMAFKKDGSSGKMVDDNMIVLRERIRKMKIDDGDNKVRLPDNWMQWEKTYTYSGGYHSDVYEAMAVLQRFLMETRPSVALGLVVIVAFGGCVSAVTVLQWLINSVPGY